MSRVDQNRVDQHECAPSTLAIVGGGMVGAVQALLLAKALPSVAITVFDRTSSQPSKRPSFDSRSTAIAPTTAQCFGDLGLWSNLQAFATPIREISVSDKGHAGMGRFDVDDNQGEPLGYVVMNAGMGGVLLDALQVAPNITTIQANVERLRPVASGAQLSWFTQSIEGAASQQSREQTYDLVIVADGVNSHLRQQLGIAAKRVDYEQAALVANVRHEKPHKLTAFERFSSNGPIAILPLGQTAQSCESTVVWTCPNEQLDHLKAASEAERLERLQVHFGFRLGHFLAMGEPAFYPLSLVLAKEQIRSHCVLMGNAAHFLHPVAGQGFNLSVRDALRLTHVLKGAANNGEPLGELTVLERYLQQQLDDQQTTIGLSHGFNRAFTRAPMPLQVLRTLGMASLEISPVVRSTFIDLLSGKAHPKPLL